MKRSKLLGLAFMAILALTSIASATASAETKPNILPAGTAEEPVNGNSSSTTTSTFGSGLTSVTSASSLGTQSQTSEKLGTFKTTFLGATSVLGKCTTAGELPGRIKVEGEFHVRDYKSGTELKTAIIFLLSPTVTFSCGSTPIGVQGCAAGAVSPENAKTATLTAKLEVASGDNKIVTVLNEANTAEEACQLLASVSGGATVLSAEATTQTLNGFTKKGAATEVEVMSL